jgi:hypothetical protein
VGVGRLQRLCWRWQHGGGNRSACV